jgi:uncharacterized protein (DUF2249 family)
MADIALDVCMLEPPEPMTRIFDALAQLADDDRLAVLIEREPHPLYAALARQHYRHSIMARADRRFDLLIWRSR